MANRNMFITYSTFFTNFKQEYGQIIYSYKDIIICSGKSQRVLLKLFLSSLHAFISSRHYFPTSLGKNDIKFNILAFKLVLLQLSTPLT